MTLNLYQRRAIVKRYFQYDRNKDDSGEAGMKLEGKPLVAAMCIGQVGNLLPSVVVWRDQSRSGGQSVPR
jgi:hypothetical protein